MWWELLTVDLDVSGKRVLLATAKDCAMEYYEAIAAGTLVPPPRGHTSSSSSSSSYSRRPAARSGAPDAALDHYDVDASIAELKRELAEREANARTKTKRGSEYLEQLRAERAAAKAEERGKEEGGEGGGRGKIGGSGGSAATTPKSPRQATPAAPPPPVDGGDSFSLADLRSRIDALAELKATHGAGGIISPKAGASLSSPPAAAAVSNNDPSYAGMLDKLRIVMGGAFPGDNGAMSAADEEAAAAAEAAGVNPPIPSPLDDVTAMLTWTAPPVYGVKPVARYQHCAWRNGAKMWISHGSMNGRKLGGDPRVLNLATMTWSARQATEEAAAVDDEEGEDGNGGGEKLPATAISGAAVAVSQNHHAYVFGGAERSTDKKTSSSSSSSTPLFPVMSVRCLDLEREEDMEDEDEDEDKKEAMEWMDMSAVVPDEPYEGDDGDAAASAGPCPRMHHTATTIGGEIFVFGGVRLDVSGGNNSGTGASAAEEETLGDLWAYNVEDLEWRLVDADGNEGFNEGDGVAATRDGDAGPLPAADAPPTPRAGHVAAAVADRFLLIWGGAAGNALSDRDLHVYDVQARRWIKPMVTGQSPKQRSGHAGCLLDSYWYVAGGGDNTSARPETYRLETKDAKNGLYHWNVVNPGTDTQAAAAGREGLSLVPFRGVTGDFIVAFGGSDGKCRGDVYVMRVSNTETETAKNTEGTGGGEEDK